MSPLTPDETILGLIAAQSQHGYQLLEAFRDPLQLGNVWNLSTSQLYAVLKRLEQRHWISGVEHRSENTPTRIEYTITTHGWDPLSAWLNDLTPSASIRRIRVEFVSRLYIAQRLRYPIEPIIAQQRAACQAEYSRLQSAQASIANGIGYLAADLVIAQLEAVMTWIDRCELVLQAT